MTNPPDPCVGLRLPRLVPYPKVPQATGRSGARTGPGLGRGPGLGVRPSLGMGPGLAVRVGTGGGSEDEPVAGPLCFLALRLYPLQMLLPLVAASCPGFVLVEGGRQLHLGGGGRRDWWC